LFSNASRVYVVYPMGTPLIIIRAYNNNNDANKIPNRRARIRMTTLTSSTSVWLFFCIISVRTFRTSCSRCWISRPDDPSERCFRSESIRSVPTDVYKCKKPSVDAPPATKSPWPPWRLRVRGDSDVTCTSTRAVRTAFHRVTNGTHVLAWRYFIFDRPAEWADTRGRGHLLTPHTNKTPSGFQVSRIRSSRTGCGRPTVGYGYPVIPTFPAPERCTCWPARVRSSPPCS